MAPRSSLAIAVGFAAEVVRETRPVVHCVSPLAATPFITDVLHGVGAHAIVTGTAPDALAAALGADAVALDLATLSLQWTDDVETAVVAARGAGVPWLLDLTTVGRTPARADRVRALLAHGPAIVRSTDGLLHGEPVPVAEAALASGDMITKVTQRDRTIAVPATEGWLCQVAGVRAAVCALMAACAAVTTPLEAALAGSAWLSAAADRASGQAHGPASFRIALVDALAQVRGDEIAEHLGLVGRVGGAR